MTPQNLRDRRHKRDQKRAIRAFSEAWANDARPSTAEWLISVVVVFVFAAVIYFTL